MAKGGESYLQMRGLMLFVMKAAMRLISGPSHSHTETSFFLSHPDLSLENTDDDESKDDDGDNLKREQWKSGSALGC